MMISQELQKIINNPFSGLFRFLKRWKVISVFYPARQKTGSEERVKVFIRWWKPLSFLSQSFYQFSWKQLLLSLFSIVKIKVVKDHQGDSCLLDLICFLLGWPPTQFFPLTKLNFVPTVSNRPSARLQSKYIEIYLPTDLFSEIEARKVQGVF